MTDEELELGAVPAEDDAPYLGVGRVSDAEFDSWVARSQAETDAALEGWDSSVEFEQRRYGDGGMTMEVEVVADTTAELLDPELDRDEEIARRRQPSWQAMAARIRAGETIGEINRQEVLEGRASACGDPSCPVCSMAARLVDGDPWVPAMRFLGYMDRPGRQLEVPAMASSPVDPLLELIRRRLATMQARRRLEATGFVVVDVDTQPRASGLVLPSDAVVGWAKREFNVPTQRETGPDNVTLTPYSYLSAEIAFQEGVGLAMLPARQATFTAIPSV